MRIDTTATYGPLTALATRDLLRDFRHHDFTLAGLSQRARTSEQTTDLLEALLEHQLVERRPPRRSSFAGAGADRAAPTYGLTQAGLAFANAKAGTVKRATATRALEQLLERVAANNADPDTTHLVTEVVLFGSYLSTDAERLGDLDIALALRDIRPQHVQDELDWLYGVGAHEQTLRRLKARSRTLSFIDLDEHREWLADKPHKSIFTSGRPEGSAESRAVA